MGTTSQVVLRVTPDEILLLMESMEGASCHGEINPTPAEYRGLWGKLEVLLEEHGEQGDTLEEILR